MTIKRKIVFSNILVLIVPLVLSLIVGIIILQTVGNRYWLSLEKMYQDDNGVYSAQSLLYAYSDELKEYNWLHYDGISRESSEKDEGKEHGEESDSDILEQTATMKDLEAELHSMGYHFVIIADNETQYSNLHEDEQQTISKYTIDDYALMDSFIINDNSVSIIKSSFLKENNSYQMLAIALGNNENINSSSYIQRYITTFILLFIGCIFVLFIAINYIVSRRLGKSILHPLSKLKDGTEQIKNGNLDFEIDYNKKDEFGDVADAFDEMRLHLKESVETRLKYENYRKNMIAGISHDLRTPLTSIKGYTEALIDGVADTDEKQEKYYNAILTRTQDMQMLVDNLSAFSKLDNENFKYAFVKTDVKELVENTVESYKDQLDININSKAQRTIVSIDRVQMQRVFVNLLENIVKHCDADSPKAKISLYNKDEFLHIDICDNGKGIEPNELEQIFTIFYRGDQSRTNFDKGSGLGLSIAKQIIIDHGGSISAKNNGGLCITISLPSAGENT